MSYIICWFFCGDMAGNTGNLYSRHYCLYCLARFSGSLVELIYGLTTWQQPWACGQFLSWASYIFMHYYTTEHWVDTKYGYWSIPAILDLPIVAQALVYYLAIYWVFNTSGCVCPIIQALYRDMRDFFLTNQVKLASSGFFLIVISGLPYSSCSYFN